MHRNANFKNHMKEPVSINEHREQKSYIQKKKAKDERVEGG